MNRARDWYCEPDSCYVDRPVFVRLPSDAIVAENLESLSGPVIVYNLRGGDNDSVTADNKH